MILKNYINFIKEADAHIDDGEGNTFWGSVGSGVLPIAKNTKKILIQYRSSWVDEPYTWGSWGGAVKGEDPTKEEILQTAVKEFKEESGYSEDLAQIIPSHIFKSGTFRYYNYIAILNSEFKPITIDGEFETYKWVTLSELLELEDKHFGLEELLKERGDQIKDIINKL